MDEIQTRCSSYKPIRQKLEEVCIFCIHGHKVKVYINARIQKQMYVHTFTNIYTKRLKIHTYIHIYTYVYMLYRNINIITVKI